NQSDDAFNRRGAGPDPGCNPIHGLVRKLSRWDSRHIQPAWSRTKLSMKPEPSAFPGRLAIQQRVLPVYRVPFFDLLAEACQGGLGVFAGQPRSKEAIPAGRLQIGRYMQAQNIHIL